MPEITIKRIKKYDLLSLFSYLHIRFQVFAQEDHRGIFGEFYLEDFKTKHYNFLLGNKAIGVARVIKRGNVIEFGRIAIKKEYRKQGYGKKFIDLLIDEVKNTETTKMISLFTLERSLTIFYQQLGFVEKGEVYFNNIPYIKMVKIL